MIIMFYTRSHRTLCTSKLVLHGNKHLNDKTWITKPVIKSLPNLFSLSDIVKLGGWLFLRVKVQASTAKNTILNILKKFKMRNFLAKLRFISNEIS